MRPFGFLLVTALLALLAAVAGCGYPKQTERNFLRACQASGQSEKRCRCSLDKIEQTVRFRDFQAYEKAAREDRMPDPKVSEALAQAALACARK
jgi:hypothetical protein